ncbi:MAG TPA: UxaA family hydrolase [Casimicrobiaceae bacterium]
MISEQVETAAQAARWDALVIHPDDDVAVALRDLGVGDTVNVRSGGAVHRITLCEAIPLGHKFARHAVSMGAPIRKYGECIGVATADIAPGGHVHIHNMASRRARRSP